MHFEFEGLVPPSPRRSAVTRFAPSSRTIVRCLSARLLTAALATVLALTASVDASQVRPVNLEEMTQRAGLIFSGRCTDVRVEKDVTLGVDVYVAEFRVDRRVKGHAGKTLTVRSPLEWAKGEDVVLFLYGESSYGLSSPVGLGQGKFSVVTDKSGHKTAVNQNGNKNLLHGLTAKATGRLGAKARKWHDGAPLDPDDLQDMAAALLR
jgi:hypothetical protein